MLCRRWCSETTDMPLPDGHKLHDKRNSLDTIVHRVGRTDGRREMVYQYRALRADTR